MKIAPKLILCATLSLLIGIAVTAPLLASELNIRPWTTHVQGPTSPFDLDVVYANFTIQNPDTPITQTSGPTINYYAVVNVTNPSDHRALLLGTDFWAAQKILNVTGQAPFGMEGNWSTGEGWEAKGAWIDGVWYNLTYTNDQYPFFDANGIMTESPFPAPSSEGHWMEGVQVYQRTMHTEDGTTTTSTYLNMNGTWTDVTGKITVDKAENGPAYSMTGPIADQHISYQSGSTTGVGTSVQFNGTDVTNTTDTRINIVSSVGIDDTIGYSTTKNINTGADAFDNHFAPGESRLIVVYGSWEVRSDWVTMNGNGYINPVSVIQSGNVQTKTIAHSVVDMNPVAGDNTFLDLWSDAVEVQQLSLTHVGNSYIYNAALNDNQTFSLDQYGAEAFITPGS
jgi:hypothetical protein